MTRPVQRRFTETKDRQRGRGNRTGAVAQPTMVMTGISKSYEGVAALTDVSLVVQAGEVHALLGENGAGKSTLMGVASGSNDARWRQHHDQRRHHFEPHAHARHRAWHRDRAPTPGGPARHDRGATTFELRYPDVISSSPATKTNRCVRCFVTSVSRPISTTGWSALSVAQRHLLELAKALVVRPRLLILDEPTAPLGQAAVDLLFTRVRAAAAGGTAVVYITHRLAEVRILASRVTVLRDGKLRGTAAVE